MLRIIAQSLLVAARLHPQQERERIVEQRRLEEENLWRERHGAQADPRGR